MRANISLRKQSSSMVINCGFCYSQIVDLNDYDIFNGTSVRKVFLKSKFKKRIWFYSRFHKPFGHTQDLVLINYSKLYLKVRVEGVFGAALLCV